MTFTQTKTYEFSFKGWEQAKQESKKHRNDILIGTLVYTVLLGLTITHITKTETLFKTIACDSTRKLVKTFIIR